MENSGSVISSSQNDADEAMDQNRATVNEGEIAVKESVGQFVEQRKTVGLSKSGVMNSQALLGSHAESRQSYRVTFSGEHGLTTFTGILALLSTILGGGIVGLPNACYSLGLPIAIALSLAMTVCTYGSAKVYLRIKDVLPDKPESLYEIGYMCYGKVAIYIVAGIQLVNSLGLMVLYFVVFSQTSGGLVASLSGNSFGDTFYCSKWFYVAILAVALIPVVLKKELAELEWLSIVLFVSIFLFLLCIFLLLVASDYEGRPEDSDIINPKNPWDILNGFAPILVAYSYQQNLFPIYGSLKQKTNDQYLKTSNLGLAASFTIYQITGILCLLLYGSNIQSDVLDNVSITYKTGVQEYWEAYVIQLAFMIVLICHIPFIFFAGKEGLLIIIDEIKRKSISSALWHKMQVSAPNFQETHGEEEPPNPDLPIPGDPSRQSYRNLAKLRSSQTPEEHRSTVAQVLARSTALLNEKNAEETNRLAYKDMPNWQYASATLILYAIITVFAFIVNNVDIVLNFASAFSITGLAFLFPGFYILKANSKFANKANKFDDTKSYNIMGYAYIVMGMANFVIAMASAVYACLPASKSDE